MGVLSSHLFFGRKCAMKYILASLVALSVVVALLVGGTSTVGVVSITDTAGQSLQGGAVPQCQWWSAVNAYCGGAVYCPSSGTYQQCPNVPQSALGNQVYGYPVSTITCYVCGPNGWYACGSRPYGIGGCYP